MQANNSLAGVQQSWLHNALQDAGNEASRQRMTPCGLHLQAALVLNELQ